MRHLVSNSYRVFSRVGRRARTKVRPALELLEGKALLAPFVVGGDPIVDAADFRVTAFASGLNFPTGVLAEPDGSLLVVVNNPPAGGTNFYNTTAQVLRLIDTTGDGVADGAPTVLASGLPGADSAIAQAGPYVITTGSNGTISFLHTGATPTTPFTLSGTINFAFPSPWEHTTYALAVRPAPGQPGDYNVFFNIGSQYNGIKKDAQGNILFDSNGVAIPDPTVGQVTASGLLSATLGGDSIYMVTLHDNNGTPVLSGLTKIATGLRNAASMAIDPATGDFLYADNGMDGTDGGNEAYSTDTLHRIAASDIGKSVPNDGFPYSYTLTNLTPGTPNTVVNPGGRVSPLASFQPLRDPNLPSTGSESEGAAGFAIAPPMFPAGLNKGAFIGFHGVFNSGGTANEENPLLYVDPTTGKYFDFVSNDEPNIGHFDGATSTTDSLFLADVASTGQVFGGPGTGVIYQIKSRGLPSTDGWQGYALDPQHTAVSPVASQALGSILWQSAVDQDPQYTGSDLLIHYGSPLITAANTVITTVKSGAAGIFNVQGRSGSSGTPRWNIESDYALMPKNGGMGYGYDWIPSYSATLTPSNRLYFGGDGGTVLYTDTPDAPGPNPPTTVRLAFFGLSSYSANPAGFNGTVFINTPITSDAAGDIFFGFIVTGSNPAGLTSGVARIGANGTGSWAPVVSGMSQVATNSAPALSNDGSTLYVLESTGNSGSGTLVALNSNTLAVSAQVALKDPHTGNNASISNDATASPMVGLDGDVYIGVLESSFASNNDRGWLLHFAGDLSKTKTPGAFGWDDTPSIVPSSMVPSYNGTSTYLLMSKYNNYAGLGSGTGQNKLAILDPNATETDPVTGTTVMNEVMTILGQTPDPEHDQQFPGAVREWCINTAVVDPATDSILAGSEDGKLYRWNLTSNSFTQVLTLTAGIGEAYTPTLIGPDGLVYAINNATLFAIGDATSAILVKSDTVSQGNWLGAYGSQGYDVIGKPASIPSYATVTPSGQTTFTWAATTTDPRALQTPDGTNRISATWYSTTSFTIAVNLNDGKAHNIALYALDWDKQGRSEQIQITSAASGAILDTETISSFSSGEYLQWKVSGSVVIRATRLSGPNAVINGLFFDSNDATASLVKSDAATQGNWLGAYGSQGYDVIGKPASIPTYATVTPSGQTTFTWAATTTDPRALQTPDGTNRISATWYSTTSFTIAVNLNDGKAHNIALYALDWDKQGRSEQIQITSAASGAILDTETISSFSSGVYLQWKVSGSVVIRATRLSGPNAVINGLFFDSNDASASLVKSDAATQGNWLGAYGSQGYDVIGKPASIPSYATVTPAGQSTATWAATTTDPRALQTPDGTNRIAATWYSSTSFTIAVNLNDGKAHNIALYALDWDKLGRSEQIQITSAASGAILDTESISSFSSGAYLQWKVSGSVVIRVTRLSGLNAVISGLFFDSNDASASLVKSDPATQGNWLGAYGSQGYDVIGKPASIPSYATVTPAGQSTATWAATTTDPRALQTPDGTNRIAATWYSSTSFTIAVNLNDGKAHNIALYALDWDKLGRSEQIQITSAASGAILDTESISSFSSGVYLQWKVSGSVVIRVTRLSGLNAVISGLFFDPPLA
jgi:uncharacterized protein YccT (UPF0319 family)